MIRYITLSPISETMIEENEEASGDKCDIIFLKKKKLKKKNNKVIRFMEHDIEENQQLVPNQVTIKKPPKNK